MASVLSQLRDDPSDRTSLVISVICVVALIVALVIVVGMFFISAAPGPERDVQGTITSFKTDADDAGVTYWMFVRLDEGGIVRVKIWRDLPIAVGRRVILRATRMPVGGERYNFKTFIEQTQSSASSYGLQPTAASRSFHLVAAAAEPRRSAV